METIRTVTGAVELIAITPNAEELIEEAGRTCYLSFDKKGPGTAQKLIRALIKSGHHSVLEHGYATFRIIGGSRAFTHQLVRHRLMAISQQSQRYCNEDDFRVIIPPAIAENPRARKIFNWTIGCSRWAYAQLQELGIRNEDARFVLPNATESEIVISANFRELRHIFYMRCAPAAQWEIRRIALQMLRIMKEKAPTVFEDFIIDEEKGIATTLIPS